MANQYSDTSYKPYYAKKILEWVGQGKSPETFARSLNISVGMMQDWALTNPEFKDALARAKSIYDGQQRRGRPAFASNVDNFIVNAALRSHEQRCPGYRITPVMSEHWLLGRCTLCGMTVERYERRQKKPKRKAWDALQDD